MENNYINIGGVKVDDGLVLGPMAGVTDKPFRILCREMGAGLLYSEMVSAKAILYNNKNTKPLMDFDNMEHPIAIQLFGSDPQIMADMAKRVYDMTGCDIIDVNMGCPVPKVVNNGEGSSLMKDEVLAGKIIETMANALEIPVTVKFRKGFDKENINAVAFAKVMESSGASAIAVHGRTREQYYSGTADWDIIRQVKEAVNVPVIGSGDVFSKSDADRMKAETGVDLVMVARGARGNPWIFKRGAGEYKPSMEEIKQMILRHAAMEVQFKGEYTGIREMRKHVSWYTAGIAHSSYIRRQMNTVETLIELEKLMDEIHS